MEKIRIVVLGPPGCGKEVQGKMVAEKLAIPYIGFRKLLCHHLMSKSRLGEEFQPFYSQKLAIPGDLMVRMLKEQVCESGFVLSGYPNNEDQADVLLKELSPEICCVIVNIPLDVSRERLTFRRIDPETRSVFNLKSNPPPVELTPKMKRSKKDTPEKIESRQKSFEEVALEKVVTKFPKVFTVNGKQSIEDVHKDILEKFKNIAKEPPKNDEE